jgi:hypothetical protein
MRPSELRMLRVPSCFTGGVRATAVSWWGELIYRSL